VSGQTEMSHILQRELIIEIINQKERRKNENVWSNVNWQKHQPVWIFDRLSKRKISVKSEDI
jgi:hypothetical protein